MFPRNMAIISSESNLSTKESVMKLMGELKEVSQEIEDHVKQLNSAFNFVQACEMKRRVGELEQKQNRIIKSIVDKHPDAAVRKEFFAISDKIEEYKPKIKLSTDAEELKKIKKEIDETVAVWTEKFQSIVYYLVNVAPPGGNADNSAQPSATQEQN